MKYLTPLLLLFITCYCFNLVQGQENEIYIQKQLAQFNKIQDKLELVNGEVYLNNDTLETMLYRFKGKRKVNNFLFCIAKTSDSIVIFYPQKILAYKIGEDHYVSHTNELGSFFLKQRILGAIDLYERMSIPSETNFNYYLRFEGASEYLVINPDAGFVKAYDIPQSTLSQGQMASNLTTVYVSTGVEEKFDLFAKTYLKACPEVVNIILADFLSMQDMPDIVSHYNKCSF